MFDKNKVQFFGDDTTEVYGPRCEYNNDYPIIGSYKCMNCKYCYRVTKRVWDIQDKNTLGVWKNAAYDGYVYCGSNDSNFLYKIKKHIFKLFKKKLYIKKLGTVLWKPTCK